MATDRRSERSARSSEDSVTAEESPGTAERRVTRRTNPSVVVGQLLEELRRSVEGHPESRDRRTLMGKLERLDTVVARWSAFPPHDDQVAAMLDVLNAMQAAIPLGP